VLSERFGLPPRRLDLETLLAWLHAGEGPDRFRAASEAVRTSTVEWIAEQVGPLARLWLGSLGEAKAPSVIALGLVLGALLGGEPSTGTRDALIRMERYLGRTAFDEGLLARWAELSVQLRRPTPLGPPLHLRARAVEVKGEAVTVETTLEAEGKLCATCRGVFVAVREGHPAFHRW
jgi:hypothetical protein